MANILSAASYSRLPFFLGFLGSLYQSWGQNDREHLYVYSTQFPNWLVSHIGLFENIGLINSGLNDFNGHDDDGKIFINNFLGLLDCAQSILEKTREPLLIFPGDFILTNNANALCQGVADVTLSGRIGTENELTGRQLSGFRRLPVIYCNRTVEGGEFLRLWRSEIINMLGTGLTNFQNSLWGLKLINRSLVEALSAGSATGAFQVEVADGLVSDCDDSNPSKLSAISLEFSDSKTLYDYWTASSRAKAGNEFFGPSHLDYILLDKWYTDTLYHEPKVVGL